MRGYKLNYFRVFWLAIYVVAAIAAGYLFMVRGMLGGDLVGVPLSDFVGVPLPDIRTLIVAASCVILSYLVWMGPVFWVMEKITVSPWVERWKEKGLPDDHSQISICVLILQIAFLVYCFMEGVGTAGSIKRTDLALKYIWILMPADAIFFVYYALYRKSHWFIPNLVVYVLSNMSRGWLGFWLIILFLEGSYRFREAKIDLKKVLAAIALFFYLVPYLIEVKWAIRKFGNAYIFNWENFIGVIRKVDWWESIVRATESLLMRLQHLDVVIVIAHNAATLSERLQNREFLYFFEEGLPQFTIERLLGWPRISDIHIKLLDYFAVEHAPAGVVSNTHTGLVGWFWIAPEWALEYVFYVGVLTWLGIWLAKKMGASAGVNDLVWFAALVWLMNGWFGAYIEFLQALVLVIIARFAINKLNNKSLSH